MKHRGEDEVKHYDLDKFQEYVYIKEDALGFCNETDDIAESEGMIQ